MWRNTVAIHSVLKKKTTKLNSQPAQYKKNKIDKDNSGKKQKKTMWKNIVAIHSVLKKKTTKQNSQPAQYEKIKSTNTILKKKEEKNS
jgi:galactokinase